MTDAIQKVIDANPDDRCAKMLQVAVGALRVINCGSNASTKTARATDKIVAQQALQKMNQLADGDG